MARLRALRGPLHRMRRKSVSGAERDLALFNLAIDSKLRGCDLVTITVGDVALFGSVRDQAMIAQKTGSGAFTRRRSVTRLQTTRRVSWTSALAHITNRSFGRHSRSVWCGFAVFAPGLPQDLHR